ncbi:MULTISPECIES: 6-carboxytetrahydropterin synthase QueD [Bradyrhizobium]|uniref:6-carboxytetrahydropterin synthase QueD n=1 Tax=Bradyrhizobium TaxID=374 RepID=UPI00068574FA|nr:MULTISPECIES: 6-carboxytetrahydropterin synthase QueD [Bradyrhizobium]MBR0946294.1 6-carboxytetrahydropterin synthase QueD [Bradyrhizobium liaoningense]MCP1768855.1 6-pyruvoyltetrahydropterin/6-carboxytetrahydropterin synthase [Bradyrhizobium japonicum]MCP1795033.1 6-pyruvoyltetrahydropterin/6-carboxytetrahydropterin synthase [Bradyrhizobium japonicum]MCP1811445.1 6-pyruvoyltetrahydropterin/6-carboxytetrahydropterin synthase [Bradyrhizobium japonicum]MCP1821645.1 6-pyruvoyltetrahydropterin/
MQHTLDKVLRVRIAAEYSFEAAHRLPMVPVDHKCHRLHGHNYKVEVSIIGELDRRGFVIDYAELDAVVRPIINSLDHRYLNEIPGLENPTSEILAEWLKDRIGAKIPFIPTVRIYETLRYWVEA